MKISLQDIDRNFNLPQETGKDVEWYDPNDAPFKIYGVFYDKTDMQYKRMPTEIATRINEGIEFLHKHTAGGRIRFITDSPFISIKCVAPYEKPYPHMTIVGSHGFCVTADNEYLGFVSPTMDSFLNVQENKIAFNGVVYTEKKDYQATVFMPLYSSVSQVYIGIKKGCYIKEPKPYKFENPILFYGSSITQGGCADKSCDDYINRLSTWLDTNVINLGFSGSAKGEQEICDYLSTLNPSIFVCDYDHNAPNSEFLRNTHYNVYSSFREKHPNTPIVLMSMPTYLNMANKERTQVIIDTYKKAKMQKDKNIYFVNGEGLLGSKLIECASVDNCHPNAFGFYLMAQKLEPLLKKLLRKTK